MPIYEKWNEDNTELINSETTDDSFKIAKLVAKGYLLVVEPAVDNATEKLGDKTWTDTERSWGVVPLDQDELAALATTAAAEAARVAEDAEIAQAILDGSLSTLTYTELEAATSGESQVIRKVARITWALLKDYNRRNLI